MGKKPTMHNSLRLIVLSITGWAASDKYNAEDMNFVNWSEVAATVKPEIYQAGRNSQNWSTGGRFSMWLGHMIVDRQNQLIYIHVGGD